MVPFTLPSRNDFATDHEQFEGPPRRTAGLDDTPYERLAELVHHLSDASMIDARRAVHHHGGSADIDDPLDIVATALVHLRRRSSTERSAVGSTGSAATGAVTDRPTEEGCITMW